MQRSYLSSSEDDLPWKDEAMQTTYDSTLTEPRAARGAVASLALCVAVLIASEFMPVSLLTPLADGLHLTEGQAGQAISVSGIFAVLTSLFISALTRGIDRKIILTSFSLLLILSGSIVTLAPNYAALMLGRVLLGIAIGGFWSMSTSVVMRLVPEKDVPRGLALLNAGNAIAATVSAPLGSYLGALIGWRGAFFFVVPLAVLALLWQWISLPPLPGKAQRSKVSSVFALLLRPQVALGMASIFLLFMGQFALFTYLRPFVETVTHLRISMLSLTLLVMGLAGVAGTWCISRLLRARLYSILIAIPLVMAVLAGLLVLFGSVQPAVAALLAAWGFFGTAAPVGWGTWLSRVLRDEAERGGGLQVAIIQFAITAGAALGGVFFDQFGWSSTFTLAAALLLGSSFAAAAAWFNNERRASKTLLDI